MLDDGKVRVSVIEQVGYREWTESLGSDREWVIQELQAKVYAEGQKEASRHGGFILPVRYDYMLLLSSNLDRESHEMILEAIGSEAKVPVRMGSACGKTPRDSEKASWAMTKNASPGKVVYSGCDSREGTAVAHVDINDITGRTMEEGVIETYSLVVDLLDKLVKETSRAGGIVQYLGGDNILVVLPPAQCIEVIDSISRREDLKAGVGIALKPREAMRLAALALTHIRSTRGTKVVVYRSTL